MRQLILAFYPLKTQRKSIPGGFALLEVLVSLTVLAVGVMVVLTAILSVLDLQKDSAQRFRASLVLQDKLGAVAFTPYNGEPMRGLSTDGLYSWTVSGSPWTGAPHLEDKKKPDGESNTANLFQVTVNVSWLTTRGTRSASASQLVQVLPNMEGPK